MKHILNNQNSMKIHASLWIYNLEKNNYAPKVSRLLLNVCDFQIESHTLEY